MNSNNILYTKLRLSLGIIGLLKYGMPWLPYEHKQPIIERHKAMAKEIAEELKKCGAPAPVNNVIPGIGYQLKPITQ